MYPLVQITPLTLGFWALAIIYPILVFVAMGNGAGYGGYSLHSLAPALAPIIGIAITTIARHWLARTVFWTLLAYNVVFLFGATLMQFVYFAGCGSDGSSHFDVASVSACWGGWQSLIDNLSVLTYPRTAFLLAAAAASALAWSMWASFPVVTSRKRWSSLRDGHPPCAT